MEITTATEADASGIAEIIKRHAQEDYMGYATFDKKYILTKMKRDHFITAKEGGLLVGCARLSMVDIDLAEIRTLCVDRDYRGRGIASSLMDKVLSISRENNIRKLITRTRVDNHIAIEFFKKFGFVEEGHFKEHYRKGIDVVQFFLFL